ncbi:MAG: PspA/IM30 family protein, partial [Microcystaceae cyanobacterium]
ELQKTLGGMDTSGPTGAFERMETKVLEMEARSQAVGELSGFGIEQQFAQLEAGSGIEDELAALKAGMGTGALPGSGEPQEALPPASKTQSSSPSDSVVDAELEELRSKLNDV